MKNLCMTQIELDNWFLRLEQNEALIRNKKGPRYQTEPGNTLSHFVTMADPDSTPSVECNTLLKKSLASLDYFCRIMKTRVLSGEELGEALEYVNDARNYLGFLGALINQETLSEVSSQ